MTTSCEAGMAACHTRRKRRRWGWRPPEQLEERTLPATLFSCGFEASEGYVVGPLTNQTPRWLVYNTADATQPRVSTTHPPNGVGQALRWEYQDSVFNQTSTAATGGLGAVGPHVTVSADVAFTFNDAGDIFFSITGRDASLRSVTIVTMRCEADDLGRISVQGVPVNSHMVNGSFAPLRAAIDLATQTVVLNYHDSEIYNGAFSYPTTEGRAVDVDSIRFGAHTSSTHISFDVDNVLARQESRLTAGAFTPPIAVEGTPFSNRLFVFDDSDTNANAHSYTATIEWGDGAVNTVTASADPNAGRIVQLAPGRFAVEGIHTYEEHLLASANRTFRVTVTDGMTRIGNAKTPFTVADAPLTAGALTPPKASVNVPLKNVRLFHFTDGNKKAPAADFSATITWGDGTTTTVTGAGGQIIATGNGGFDVVGSHTYSRALAGATFRVAVTDKGGSKTSATGKVSVVTPRWSFVTLGDFNGDGTTDMLWRDQISAMVSARLITGGQVTKTTYLTHVNPSTLSLLAVADFNGDKTDDIAWRDKTTGAVTIQLVKNGVLSATTNPGTASPIWKFQGIGDFNGDGTKDLAWQHQSLGLVAVWLVHNGSATGAVPGPTPPGSTFLTIGDFNGDGTSDLAFRDNSTGMVRVWLIKNGAISVETTPRSASSSWRSLGAGDFNRDRTTDLAWLNTVNSTVAVWLMRGGTYLAGTSPGKAPTGTTLLTVGDFNGDKADDLVWRNSTNGAVTAWLLKDGLLTATQALGTARPASWLWLGAGDFNRDGAKDLLWQDRSNGSLWLWLTRRATSIPSGSVPQGTIVRALTRSTKG